MQKIVDIGKSIIIKSNFIIFRMKGLYIFCKKIVNFCYFLSVVKFRQLVNTIIMSNNDFMPFS